MRPMSVQLRVRMVLYSRGLPYAQYWNLVHRFDTTWIWRVERFSCLASGYRFYCKNMLHMQYIVPISWPAV